MSGADPDATLAVIDREEARMLANAPSATPVPKAGTGQPEEGPIGGGPIIEARGVSKTYDTGTVQVNALSAVDVTIRRGEMVSVLGPSGCGKTTLLNCLSGLDAVDGGEVLIEGVALATTLAPAVRASRIFPAEALRYE